ncbi:hypothetical protein CALCODRAFT_14688 [Calocera cornea HHB12733]|uniref:Uncharacterized protein n=1 Tax=Calocera cornea HHB12733 TaxID=1353952 RepID=A0A165E9E5_9BASI|nr:hypothetical protein CALCODRAFT_14688 [Calocera cornea HHB12733]
MQGVPVSGICPAEARLAWCDEDAALRDIESTWGRLSAPSAPGRKCDVRALDVLCMLAIAILGTAVGCDERTTFAVFVESPACCALRGLQSPEGCSSECCARYDSLLAACTR